MMENKDMLRLGFGKREITPHLGTPLVGYYSPRVAKGVLDPLFVRAALFEADGKTKEKRSTTNILPPTKKERILPPVP